MRVPAIFLLALSVYTVAADLTQSAYLDVQEKFYIEWQYTDTNITILAKVKTTGWFGIGFSPNGGMAGADIITASVVNGRAVLQDRFAERNGYPTVDSSQDVQLISGSEVNGVTTIKFTRKHNTCDDKDLVVGLDTMRMIWAISPDGSDTLAYHTPFNRGTRSILLRKRVAVPNNIPSDAFTFDMVVKDVEIPAYHTMYYCEVLRAPKLDSKHHIIQVDPVIQAGNEGVVHHMLLYGCYDSINRESFFQQNKTSFQCYNNANMPRDLDRCRAPVTVWAVGGGPTIYPDVAGYPIGDDKSPDYFLIEIHYDNPKLISGMKDSSGLRFTITKSLRTNDAGVIEAGGIFGLAAPPRTDDFASTTFCTSDCTKEGLKRDVNIFGIALHGHIAARQIIARQFRNGKELRTIDEDRHYDFNYQQYRLFEKTLDLKPGDDIMMTCHYDTSDRKAMTYGGLPTTSEMCLSFIFYYPAQDLSECLSLQPWVANYNYVTDSLGFKANRRSSFDQGLQEMTRSKAWTKDRVEKMVKDQYTSDHLNVCTNRARHRLHGNYQKYTPPKGAIQPPPRTDYSKQCANTPDTIIG